MNLKIPIMIGFAKITDYANLKIVLAEEGLIMFQTEYTLVLVKPDGIQSHHLGEIITRIERKNYQITALKMIEASENQLRRHYSDKVNQSFFPELIHYMQEGPIAGIVVAGTNVVKEIRKVAGVTNPGDATVGTIRADFGREWPDGVMRNVVHTSDSAANAQREIQIWFPELKLSK